MIAAEDILKCMVEEAILAPDVDPSVDDALINLGLDSMALMQWMIIVEQKFGIVMQPEDLALEHIHSARSMAQRLEYRGKHNDA
jgi:acyl carrier protein